MTRRSSEYPVAVAKATELIKDYGISKPSEIDTDAIAYDQGVFVTIAALDGASARLVRRGRRGVIRVSNRVREQGQQRFCVAHELGHFLLHTEDRHLLSSSESSLYWYGQSSQEPEANAFAAELLMPGWMFNTYSSECELSLHDLGILAETFRTTLTATSMRYVTQGPNICALVVCEKGMIKWFHRGTDFIFKLLPIGTRTNPMSGAGGFFADEATAPDVEQVPVMCWLEDERVSTDLTIGELVIPLPSYQMTLSILWSVPGSGLDIFAGDL